MPRQRAAYASHHSQFSRYRPLVNVIIHRPSSNREELLTDAMRMLSGPGLPDAKVRLLGRETVQRFEWETANGKATSNNLLETIITKVGTNWELYASLSR